MIIAIISPLLQGVDETTDPLFYRALKFPVGAVPPAAAAAEAAGH